MRDVPGTVHLFSQTFVVGVEPEEHVFHLLNRGGARIGQDISSAAMFWSRATAEEFIREVGEGKVYQLHAKAEPVR